MDRLRFQLDEHMPRAMADALRRRGIDVSIAADVGLRGMSDDDLLAHAQDAGRVLVTHDADFLRLHRQRQHAGIAYSEQGARTLGQLVASLVLMHELLMPDEMANRVEYL